MAGYQDQHPTGLMASIRSFLGSFGGNAGRNFNNRFNPAQVRQNFSNNPMATAANAAMTVTNPVGTAVNELGRTTYQSIRDAADNNSYNNYMNDLFESDPGYTGNYSSGGSGYAGVFNGSPANSFLTGNFSPSQLQGGGEDVAGVDAPLVDLNYGQNPQEYQMAGGGTPGITGPNIYGGSTSIPQFSPTGGAATTLAGAGRGMTVGTMTMSQLENMLSAGIGQNNRAATMTQSRELDEMRSNARRNGNRPAGMSVRDYLMQ